MLGGCVRGVEDVEEKGKLDEGPREEKERRKAGGKEGVRVEGLRFDQREWLGLNKVASEVGKGGGGRCGEREDRGSGRKKRTRCCLPPLTTILHLLLLPREHLRILRRRAWELRRKSLLLHTLPRQLLLRSLLRWRPSSILLQGVRTTSRLARRLVLVLRLVLLGTLLHRRILRRRSRRAKEGSPG